MGIGSKVIFNQSGDKFHASDANGTVLRITLMQREMKAHEQ
jgi:hypothetical protein